MKAITSNFETCEFLNSSQESKGDTTLENLISLLDQRAKEKTTFVGKTMQANPELWDDLQGIHVREMVEAYVHSYNTQTF
jgi:hypothetical protein